eukprot:6764693-Alexandrium_andersonii.AAC.1
MSSKISLTVKASYDAELHAAQANAEAIEGLQFALSELETGRPAGDFLRRAPEARRTAALVVDAKGVYDRMENAFATDKKHGGVYARLLVETLQRI